MIEDGGPAFPQQGATLQMKDNVYFLDKGGMSLRDYFAAAAMQGMLATLRADEEPVIHAIAVDAFKMADAMLSGRSGTGQMNITTTSSEHREEK
jgi:hypothetical protein